MTLEVEQNKIHIALEEIPWEFKPVRLRLKHGRMSEEFMAMHYKGLCYLPTPKSTKLEGDSKIWSVVREVSGRQLAVNSPFQAYFRFETENKAALFLVKIGDLTDWSELENPAIGSSELRTKVMGIYFEVKKLETVVVG
jgi:hypothetical protein